MIFVRNCAGEEEHWEYFRFEVFRLRSDGVPIRYQKIIQERHPISVGLNPTVAILDQAPPLRQPHTRQLHRARSNVVPA